jgi:hypothetical protein
LRLKCKSRREGVGFFVGDDLHAGAAARCDLLIVTLKNQIKRSQPRFTRQLLQGAAFILS